MNLYTRLTGSQLGSSALFGAAFFAATFASDGAVEALRVGSLAAASWFAAVPLLRRLVGGEAA